MGSIPKVFFASKLANLNYVGKEQNWIGSDRSLNALLAESLPLLQFHQIHQQISGGLPAPPVPMVDRLLCLVASVSLELEHALPVFIGRVAVEALGGIEFDGAICEYFGPGLESADLLEVGAVFAALAPDDICVYLVVLEEEEELLAVGLVLVVVVDGSGVAVEHPHVLAVSEDVGDDLPPAWPVHAGRRLLPAAEGAEDGLGLPLVLHGTDAVAAELVLAGETGGGEDDVRADRAHDVVVQLLVHDGIYG